MLAEQHADQLGDGLVVRAPAKVNLFLEILNKRSDGYHELVSLLVAVDLFDILVFEENPGRIELSCDQAQLDTGPDNLVLRAAELLRQPHPLPPARPGRSGEGVGGEVPLRSEEGAKGARIRLAKRIPMAAGLAGGSSDAAATLFALNRLWQLGLSEAGLAELGAKLGSDVPFFFSGGAAWCTGRGEIVTPTRLPRPLDLVLACPPVGLATADVYRHATVPVEPRSAGALRRALAGGNVEAIGAELHNRLQEPAERLCPAVAELRQLFEALKPAGQAMSGSGSCCFALCRGPEEAQDFAQRVQAHDPRLRVFVTRTLVNDEGLRTNDERMTKHE